jgi:hypothetical protein
MREEDKEKNPAQYLVPLEDDLYCRPGVLEKQGAMINASVTPLCISLRQDKLQDPSFGAKDP